MLLAAALSLRHATALVWSLVLLGGSYALWLALGTHALDQRAPVVGAGLLLVAELSFDSLEPEIGRVETPVLVARALVIAAAVVAAMAAGVLVIGAAAVPLRGGVAVTALGAVAAVLVLALIARLARDRR